MHKKDENDKILKYDINKKFQISYMGTLMCIAFKIVSMIQNLETIFDDIFIKTILQVIFPITKYKIPPARSPHTTALIPAICTL